MPFLKDFGCFLKKKDFDCFAEQRLYASDGYRTRYPPFPEELPTNWFKHHTFLTSFIQ